MPYIKLSDRELSKGDYISLGKAVAKFNRTINELKTKENESYLPMEIDYKNFKKTIVSKNEIDKYVKKLRNFSKENAKLLTLEGGSQLTEWEYNLAKEEKTIALRRMSQKLRYVNPYDKQAKETLETNIKNLKNFEKLKNDNFIDTLKRIHNIGRSDYELRRAIQFRKNFYIALEELKNYKNYELLKNKLDSIKDDIKFADIILDSKYFGNLLSRYIPGKGVTLSIGSFVTDEESFNYALIDEFNLNIEE